MTQKNTEFEVAKTSIIDEFNAAIQSENSDKLKGLLEEHGYNGTEGTDDSIDAVIGELNTIIEVNKDIESNKREIKDSKNRNGYKD